MESSTLFPVAWPHGAALMEGGVLLAAVLFSVALTHRLARAAGGDALCIWRGAHGWDGALFPLLALLLVFLGGSVLQHFVPVQWLPLAMPLLLALCAIRFAARVLRRLYPQVRSVRWLERGFSWLVWAWALLHAVDGLPGSLAEGLQGVALNIGKSEVSLLNLAQALLALGLALVAVLWLSSLAEERLLSGWIADLSLRSMAVRILRSVLFFVTMVLVLSALGVDLTALSVMGGALGMGLGFGMQKIASNYVSGFVVLLERLVRIGDLVRVDGFEGRIVAIRTRCTTVRAANGREANVPNEALITQRVEKLDDIVADSARDAQPPAAAQPLETRLVVAAHHDAAQVQRTLLAAAAQEFGAGEAVQVLLEGFPPQGLQFVVTCPMGPHEDAATARSRLNLALLRGLRAAGLQLAAEQAAQASER